MQHEPPHAATAEALTPELMLTAYAAGIFPMAEDQVAADVFWVDPRERGVMPLEDFHISRSLRRRLLRTPLVVRADTDFAGVVAGCADRHETWINDRLVQVYHALHRGGHAHSVEVFDGPALVGGVFGVTLGAAFFGESMFSRATDASKIALAYLVDRLRRGGFTLFDTQFPNPHLESLGGAAISRAEYRRRLQAALGAWGDFAAPGPLPAPQALLQRSSQTS